MKKFATLGLMLLLQLAAFAQKTLPEYVEKNSRDEIMKSIQMPAGSQPTTPKSYDDGHGKNPLIFSKTQLPDTIALVTVYVFDEGATDVSKIGSFVYTDQYWISAEGGNLLANEILREGLDDLRAAFKQRGVVLLTPDQFLNTPEKKAFYKNFQPEISRMGNFISGLEKGDAKVTVTADGYRIFDAGAAKDYLRAESMGSVLASKLGVDGVLHIGIDLSTNATDVYISGIKMVLNAPNPIPRQDKKYVGQKLGTGWYAGQVFASGDLMFKKPLHIVRYKKQEKKPAQLQGIGTIFSCFADRFYNEMEACAVKAAKKYGKS